ncbi:hypothetical protein [Ideonella sp. BN130291]|uniref:hypothetical protein n=1 Tax=Ideonella sp. BN130291 TaxID=3112940 RepID=UPI002E27669D|nr:hypothetical protein [Ideonella sp. BN130291]
MSPLLKLAKVLFLVAGRALLVLCIGIPVLLLVLLAGVFGSGGGSGALLVFITAALAGLGWACLPLIHASRAGGMAFACCWVALAVAHIVTQPDSLAGEAVVAWSVASLWMAIKLRSDPPSYFPESWKRGSASGAPG